MIDNLTEAISHAKEVVEDKREEIAYWNKVKGVGVFTDENTEHLLTKCEECASEHEQLAEWLTELQSDRKLINVIRSIVWDNSLYDGIKIDKLRRLLSAYKESEAENES